MKKEPNQASVYPISNLKIISPDEPLAEAVPYRQAKPEPASVINLHVVGAAFSNLPLDGGLNRAIKRSMDIFLSVLVILALLSWLMPLIAVLIKLNSRGPVFFLQLRNKRNGELFTCIKFRSMFTNADADVLPACKNDNRITSAGKFLRKHHLDELPQFFNVLWGDMAIVGPRPHMVSDNVRFDPLIKNYAQRNKVKPGITGLAQVTGYAGATDDMDMMKGRVNMDIFYLRHWSVRLDLAILYRTLFKIRRF